MPATLDPPNRNPRPPRCPGGQDRSDDSVRVWSDADLTNPHAIADKASRVRQMFAAIAPSYDLNNRLHSLGRDQAWRRAAVKMADLGQDDRVLDVACGTGDLALAFAQAGTRQIIGVDFTFDMLLIARRKSDSACVGMAMAPYFGAGDALRLPLASQSVDVVSIAFGIRNVVNPNTALTEFARVLRPGGRLIILEFRLPSNAILGRLYNFYFSHILPRTASFIARDRTGAYHYLPKSVHTFLDQSTLLSMIRGAGFIDTVVHPLTLGVAAIYRGRRPTQSTKT